MRCDVPVSGLREGAANYCDLGLDRIRILPRIGIRGSQHCAGREMKEPLRSARIVDQIRWRQLIADWRLHVAGTTFSFKETAGHDGKAGNRHAIPRHIRQIASDHTVFVRNLRWHSETVAWIDRKSTRLNSSHLGI